tara:strand:+ start:86715 stop:87140 length:426 start_codon:yes stop_codon:yes gene_type:complete
MNIPKLIEGGTHKDQRGEICFNNSFDGSQIKRIYSITNSDTELKREWQGHKIEQRWFSVVAGSFRIKVIAIDNWEAPTKDLEQKVYLVSEEKLDILHLPSGYVSSIQALKPNSKLLVMADYMINEIEDEYRYETGYFTQED